MNRGLSAHAWAQRTRSSAFGTGPAKPPTSCPVSNRPGEPHRQRHPLVPAQRMPARGVVAGPGLRVTLDPWRAGASDRVDTFARRVPALRLECRPCHEQRVQRARARDRNRLAESVRAAVLVPDLVFVVVVPAGIDAVSKHLLGEPPLPPGDRGRMREVEMRAPTVPELSETWRAGGCIGDEAARGIDLGERRVIVQQTGLEVRDQAHARVPELLRQGAGIGKFLAIPGEHVATFSAARITRSEMERRQRNALGPRPFEEHRDTRLRIGRIGERHRGVRVAQRPARRKRCRTRELDEAPHHHRDRGARDEPAIEVTVGDLGASIEAVVVVELLPEIECRFRQRVVVDAVADTTVGATADEERPMLVQRIARRGVVAECVELQRPQPAPGLVERSGLVSEAEVLVVAVAHDTVAQPGRAGCRSICVTWTVRACEHPAVAITNSPVDTEWFEAHDCRNGFASQLDAVGLPDHLAAAARRGRLGHRAIDLPRERRAPARSPRCVARGSLPGESA